MMPNDDAAAIEPHRLVWPGSWVGHIPFASWLVAVLRPDVLVELGTHTGNSYAAFCQAIVQNKLATRAWAVDTWRGDEHAGAYDESVFRDLQRYHDPLYGGFSTLLRITFDEAAERFAAGSVDLLHIDGLHTYEAVKHDFETWLPKVSARGVVLFHDTNVHDATFGVHRLWAEVSQRYPGFQFEHSHGLGVLLVGEQRRPELLELAESAGSEERWRSASRVFRELGGNVERQSQVVDLNHTLREREAHIAILEQAVRALQKAVSDRDTHIVGLERQMGEVEAHVAHLNAHVAHLNAVVNDRDAQLAHLHAVVNDREAQLVAQRNTISWRITKPLRLIRR